MSTSPPTLLASKYALAARLAEGGMGEVWEATHVVTGRAVAIKLLKSGAGGAEASERMLREARAACAVEHPAIVAIHDVVHTEAGEPALVMELLRGETLAAKLERRGALSAAELAQLLAPAMEALRLAHSLGIVHRDIKPSNLFVTTMGEVKLLDFGLAKDLAPSAGVDLTRTGSLVGTPLYMSPEQAFGERVDHRTDVWSMGLVLYESLTGALPTRADSVGQVLKLILTAKLAPLGELAPHVPPELAAAVMHMLERDVSRRASSFDEVLRALAGAAGGAPTASTPLASPGSVARTGATDVALADTVAGPGVALGPVRAATGASDLSTAVAGRSAPGAGGTSAAIVQEGKPTEARSGSWRLVAGALLVGALASYGVRALFGASRLTLTTTESAHGRSHTLSYEDGYEHDTHAPSSAEARTVADAPPSSPAPALSNPPPVSAAPRAEPSATAAVSARAAGAQAAQGRVSSAMVNEPAGGASYGRARVTHQCSGQAWIDDSGTRQGPFTHEATLQRFTPVGWGCKCPDGRTFLGSRDLKRGQSWVVPDPCKLASGGAD